MPKVSIIIAVYNVEKYLKKCLDSLVNQTLTDIEIICTDDGSTDNSLSILKEYQASDNRIKIIEQENQGPGVARNIALEMATGKYIIFVDPDDWLELNACELAYNQIEQNQNDLVIFDYKRYDESTGEYFNDGDKFIPYKDCIDNPHINVANLKTNFFQNGYIWHKIYNRKFLNDKSLKFLPQYLCEDGPVAILSLAYSKNISILNTSLYVYRVRSTSSSFNVDRWQEFIYSRKYIAEYLISERFSNTIISNYLEYMFFSLSYWYDIYKAKNSSITEQYKKDMYTILNNTYNYMNKRTKFHFFIYKYNLEGVYYKLIRPIGKYCVVLPYRRIKKFLKVHK